MVISKIYRDVERWLVHENYRFNKLENPENNFHLIIKHIGSFGNAVEIFQPKKQESVIVLGSKVPLKNNQNARYLKLNDIERERLEKKIESFCSSIKAVYRMTQEEGKKKIGVYVVLDKEEQINQQTFLESITQVAEMSDKTSQFLIKVF